MSTPDNSYPQDTFNLAFGQIEFRCSPQSGDGSLGPPVIFCFNVKAGKPC
jgi:hypothetical protein